jgi:hypothetical protein
VIPTYVLVWRGGRPTVVTLCADGRRETDLRMFDDDHTAIAYLLRLAGAGGEKDRR